MSEDIVRQYLEDDGAFWLYSGEPRAEAPHALLTSGKHSNGYVNVGGVLKQSPAKREGFAGGIIAALSSKWNGKFDWVTGADTSSTDLAGNIARMTDAGHIRMIKNVDSKEQTWHPGNKPLREGDKILQIEELITTSFSALQVRQGIRLANPNMKVMFVPFLPVIVERSDPDNRVVLVEESTILPLLQLDIRNYDPDACPYCAAGSEAIKPKVGDNWLKLTHPA